MIYILRFTNITINKYYEVSTLYNILYIFFYRLLHTQYAHTNSRRHIALTNTNTYTRIKLVESLGEFTGQQISS